MITKEQLAASLDGCQYRQELNAEWSKIAKQAGLIVIYGASDDLMEFGGAVYDELGAPCEALLYKHNSGVNVVDNDSDIIRQIEDDFLLYQALGAMMDRHNLVAAKWCPVGFAGEWLITTELPHAAFDVMNEDELYCRGVVISIADLK